MEANYPWNDSEVRKMRIAGDVTEASMNFEDNVKSMGTFAGTITGVVTKSQYELDKDKGFPMREYIRQIVREELAAHEERLGCSTKSLQDGKKVFPL